MNIYRSIANVPFTQSRTICEHGIYVDSLAAENPFLPDDYRKRIENDPMVFDDREIPIEPQPEPGKLVDDEDSCYRDNSEDDE